MKDPHDSYAYVFWNRGMERLYGLSASAVIGATDAELFGDDVAATALKEDREVLRRQGKPMFGRPRPTGIDGSTRFVQHGKFLVLGERELIVSFVTDVTALVESKRKMKSVQEWQELMLSLVSHDVLSPLDSLVNGLRELEETQGEMSEEQRSVALSFLRAGAQRTKDLVENILLWSRSSEPDRALTIEEVELTSLARRVLRRVEMGSGATLRLESPEFLAVTSNARALEGILRNILTNAVEHGGTTALVTVAESPELVSLRVVDQGPGIPERHRGMLNNGTIPEELNLGGNGRRGIGLKLCLTLAERLGGRLTFDDAPAGGATVELSLPKVR